MTSRQSGQASAGNPQGLLGPLYLDAWRDVLVPTSDRMLKQAQRWSAVSQAMVDEAQVMAKSAAEHVEALTGLHNATAQAFLSSGGLTDIAGLNAKFAQGLMALGAAEARRRSASMSRVMSAAWPADSAA